MQTAFLLYSAMAKRASSSEMLAIAREDERTLWESIGVLFVVQRCLMKDDERSVAYL